MKKTRIAAASVVAGVAATSIIGLAPAASAACVKTDLSTGYHRAGSTVTVSYASTCNDLNLTRANDTSSVGYDGYAGYYYKSSTGQWIRGASGYHFTKDFTAYSSSSWIVLLTAISNGTRVGVASYYDAPDYVTVAH
jgi:hypothetical protein